jgi:hypothetical protein
MKPVMPSAVWRGLGWVVAAYAAIALLVWLVVAGIGSGTIR